jgi:nucleoside-triphosphatase THEP1
MNKLVVVTGGLNSGKTTLLTAYCSRLDFEKGLRMGGVACTVPLPGKEKNDYVLYDLRTGETRLAMSLKENANWPKKGRFYIDPTVFDWANSCIVQAFPVTDCLVFDEIGNFEIEGGGLSPSFRAALKDFSGMVVAVIRDTLLEQVAERFSLDLTKAEFLRTAIPLSEQFT